MSSSTVFLNDQYVNNVISECKKPLNEIGEFVYYRTYSRWLDELRRRERWHETVRRATNFNVRLAYDHLKAIGVNIDIKDMEAEAELMFKNIYLTRQFPSGRTMWIGDGNKTVNEKFALGNFNCSFTNIQKWEDLGDIMHLLLVGSGAGIKSTLKSAKAMPKIRTQFKLIHKEYKPVAKEERLEHTRVVDLENGYLKVYIGDSKEGWTESVVAFLEALTDESKQHIHTIVLNYNSVRPKGERLKTFGGTASGHEPLKEMFEGFRKVLQNEIDPSLASIELDENGFGHIRPIHLLDMANLIGANVVVGGVRRTAEIFLFDAEDFESTFAKFGINGIWGEEGFAHLAKVREMMEKLNIPVPAYFDDLAVKYYYVNDVEDNRRMMKGELSGTEVKKIGEFTSPEEATAFAIANGYAEGEYYPYPCNEKRPLHHRRMSNNSIAFTKKPNKKHLNFIFTMMQMEGEPGFINLEETARRRLLQMGITKPSRKLLEDTMFELGLNPCAEILLASYGVCNLTTVNVKAFVSQDANGKYKLDLHGLVEAQKLSSRIGVRMTLAKLELEHWNDVQNRDRLIGTSLTGWKDALDLIGADEYYEAELLKILRDTARSEADRYAKSLRIAVPLLVTTVKPEGTISQVAGGVSSGVHWSHAPFYIRRIRINSHDPLVKVAQQLGWTINPEVGTSGATFEEKMANAKTYVIDFPIASGAERTKDDVSAKEQLDTYFRFMDNYVEHNASNTISVKPDEWLEVEDIIFDGWDNFVGVSFLASNGGTYQLAPYEAISEEKYHELKSKMKPFDALLLQKIEKAEFEAELTDDDCASGACGVR
jgi:ribonucleoside-diphosphate reductase alpha chain/ribonucleoside-triphosphate reductase